MTDLSKLPLRCEYHDGVIDMRVGVDVLRFAAENHPYFWMDDQQDGVPNITITDINAFAREVVNEINREEENGDTPLILMLDKAIRMAVENGCEGVDHEAKAREASDE